MQDKNLPIWLARLAVRGGPRFLQIADALRAAVVDESLKPGDHLPLQRQLAAQLDVDQSRIRVGRVPAFAQFISDSGLRYFYIPQCAFEELFEFRVFPFL